MSNRYVIAGIIEDLSQGKFVFLVNHTVTAARHIFREIIAALPEDAAQKIRRAHGREEITTVGGGRLRMCSINKGAGLRGAQPDVLVAIDSLAWTAEEMERLLDAQRIIGADTIRA